MKKPQRKVYLFSITFPIIKFTIGNMAHTFQTHQQFKCNSCGGELRLISKRTQFVGCPYCGAVADAHTTAYKVIAKMEKPSFFPPYTFLEIGLIGTFEGKQYQIIGRTRFNSKFKEYWADDEGSGYSDEFWEYDEWQLLGEDFTYFYLIEDAEGFKSSIFFYPEYPNLPRGTNINAFKNNKNQRLEEYGSTEINYFEGEATYLVKVGSTHDFAMYKSGGDSYEVESRLSDSKEVKEISFYKEKSYKPEEILTAFEDNEKIKLFAQTVKEEKKSRKRISLMYVVACIVCFFMMFLSIGENDILMQSLSLADYKMKNKTDSLTEYEVYSDFFDLKDTGRVHGVYIGVEMPDNMDSYTEVEINDSKGEVVNELVGNFYRSSGVDGGESWTEDVTVMEEFYQLDTTGRYRIKMNVQISQDFPKEIRYILRVYRTDLSRYYLGGFFFFLALSIYASRSPNLLKRLKR